MGKRGGGLVHCSHYFCGPLSLGFLDPSLTFPYFSLYSYPEFIGFTSHQTLKLLIHLRCIDTPPVHHIIRSNVGHVVVQYDSILVPQSPRYENSIPFAESFNRDFWLTRTYICIKQFLKDSSAFLYQILLYNNNKQRNITQ